MGQKERERARARVVMSPIEQDLNCFLLFFFSRVRKECKYVDIHAYMHAGCRCSAQIDLGLSG